MMIGSRAIASDQPPYIIAEIGVNHDGDAGRAVALADAAADAGADAIKLQLFETDRLMSRAAKLAAYQRAAGATDPVAMLRALELPIDAMAKVVRRAHERGLHAIVTVFSVELVEHAEQLTWDAYKTASPDIIHRPLLERLAATGTPLIVSTGASEMDEVRRAVGWLAAARDRLSVLQCVSSYPTRREDASLGAIDALRALGVPVGYSDHTREESTGALATARGACVLEKHLTWSRRASGPDHSASLEPDEFARYVRAAHLARAADTQRSPLRYATFDGAPEMGPSVKRVLECERDVREVSRQSIVTTRPLPAGHTLYEADLTFKRPGTGLAPFRIGEVLGRELGRSVDADLPLRADDLA